MPTEKSWPCDVAKFTRPPSDNALKTARWHQAGPKTFRCDEDQDGETTASRSQALAAGRQPRAAVALRLAVDVPLGEARRLHRPTGGQPVRLISPC
jgi:hypothetical protein